ncbi:Tropinesterase [Burkholderiales bacterium]|nr:MAG: alpha/beta hydrolase [Burkholderiales bacterium]CAG0950365.1 Tropinesterase [Burkholderiales bacterium]
MPPSPREGELLGLASHGFYRCRYYEWGDAANPEVVICVHGLTRNGRDFDDLARALAPHRRVLCIDMPGRGKSEWLPQALDYRFETYLALLTALIARSAAARVDWVGTSMGAMLGMMLAAQANTPLRRLVVNDAGPVLQKEALARIGGYLGLNPEFADFAALERHIREVSAPFGALSDAQWRRLAETTARPLPDGRYALAYDPGIAAAFRVAAAQDIDLWHLWEAIKPPVLLLRGAESDLLKRDTALAMTQRGPGAQLLEFEGVGHAPMLLDATQIDPVVDFLLRA